MGGRRPRAAGQRLAGEPGDDLRPAAGGRGLDPGGVPGARAGPGVQDRPHRRLPRRGARRPGRQGPQTHLVDHSLIHIMRRRCHDADCRA
ncbi:hypothetical protein SCOCK_480028 [Actinacidiphila cocklensis]|uniref:Uncharacterized protein n=1 Tax=Actinacidiphila cocklensis TaxID=887465 RepID=A0A9W4DVC3_9ACTN|nr:hypothetical protein SCOCK_480028 [Actinacidiphila cocklensis]